MTGDNKPFVLLSPLMRHELHEQCIELLEGVFSNMPRERIEQAALILEPYLVYVASTGKNDSDVNSWLGREIAKILKMESDDGSS